MSELGDTVTSDTRDSESPYHSDSPFPPLTTIKPLWLVHRGKGVNPSSLTLGSSSYRRQVLYVFFTGNRNVWTSQWDPPLGPGFRLSVVDKVWGREVRPLRGSVGLSTDRGRVEVDVSLVPWWTGSTFSVYCSVRSFLLF